MNLNLYTDIGLKTIMYLKVTNNLVTLNEISNQFDIPKNHLIKVANFLVKSGYIIAIRGRNGGLKYHPDSDNVVLGELIKSLEGQKELLGCDDGGCRLRSSCGLRSALNEALDQFYTTLNKYTISDITKGGTSELILKMHLSQT